MVTRRMIVILVTINNVVSIFTIGYQLDEHQLFWLPAILCQTFTILFATSLTVQNRVIIIEHYNKYNDNNETSLPGRLSFPPPWDGKMSISFRAEYGGCRLWQPVQADTQPSRLGSAAAWRRSTFIKCQLDFNKDYYYYNGATNLGALKGGGH